MERKKLPEVAFSLEHMAFQEDLSKAEELLEQIKTEFGKLELFVSQPDWIEIARQQAKIRNKNICVHRQVPVSVLSPHSRAFRIKTKKCQRFLKFCAKVF